MCWITRLEENAVLRTAEADIPVFKVVTHKHRPSYFMTKGFLDVNRESCPADAYAYEYEEGKTYAAIDESEAAPLTILPYMRSCFTVCEGFHSYSPDTVVRRSANTEPGRVTLINTEPGCVTLITPITVQKQVRLDWFREEYAERMDCVIPKGASYVLNEYGEYVSDRLRVTGFRPLTDPSVEGE